MPTETNRTDGPGSTTTSSNANSTKTASRRTSAGKKKIPKSTALATLPVTSSPPKFPYYHPADDEFAISLPQDWIAVPVAKKRIRHSRESSSEELQLKTPTSPDKL